ncbi:MAG TPA: hypothetical protein EYP19_13395, partial [Desulfobacterales bacterium]|nr:hypothetical protein [Desulfobacterales bacterium]
MTDIEFKIGQEHENMKGAYKVLSIDRDAMCICWEDGEEITTTVALQGRIIGRMHRELALMRGNKGRKTKKPRFPEYVSKFEGLKEDDFSQDVAGATWRHYDSLGGAVAVRLHSDEFEITPWPRYGLSAINWGDLNHRGHDDFRLQANFFARLDEKCLYFGLDIERSNQEEDAEEDAKDDWNAFTAWLRDAKNDSWLNEVVCKHDLSIYDMKEEGALSGSIISAGGKWALLNEGKEQEIESLAGFFDDLTGNTWVGLQIVKIVEKGEVVTRGVEIADDIARLFEVLMPLYETLCR